MTKDQHSEKSKPDDREAKLAQALRANLRRRKAGPDSKPSQGGGGKSEEGA